MEFIDVEDKKTCEELRGHSAMTFVGLVADGKTAAFLPDWVEKQGTKLLNERVFVIKGQKMNEWYGLTDSNAYKPDLTIVCVDLQDIENVYAIILPSKQIGARWLDDVIDNNLRRQKEFDSEDDKPVCKLIGEDGNIFNLIGLVRRTLKKAGKNKEAEEMQQRAFAAGGYDEVLRIFAEYVEVR